MVSIEQLYNHLKTLTSQWFYTKAEIDSALATIRNNVAANTSNIASNTSNLEALGRTVTALQQEPGKEGQTIVHIAAEENISEAVSDALMDARIPVLSMTETRATLEEAFLKLMDTQEQQETVVEEEEVYIDESDI